MIIGFILAAAGHVIMFFAGDTIPILASGWIIASIGSGIACSMPFAMLSDSVDYGEWKTGIRASGFLTAIGSAFCIKAGSGIGGFIPAMVLDAFGYVPNAVQSAQSLFGIQIVFIWLPFIIFLLGFFQCFFIVNLKKMKDKLFENLHKDRSDLFALLIKLYVINFNEKGEINDCT